MSDDYLDNKISASRGQQKCLLCDMLEFELHTDSFSCRSGQLY